MPTPRSSSARSTGIASCRWAGCPVCSHLITTSLSAPDPDRRRQRRVYRRDAARASGLLQMPGHERDEPLRGPPSGARPSRGRAPRLHQQPPRQPAARWANAAPAAGAPRRASAPGRAPRRSPARPSRTPRREVVQQRRRNFALVGEMEIEGALRRVRCPDDVVNRGAVIALVGEHVWPRRGSAPV